MWPMASVPGSSLQDVGGEDVGDVAHGFAGVDDGAVAGGDAGALLASVLQGVEREVGEFRGFGVAVDGDYSAFFVEFVVRIGMV